MSELGTRARRLTKSIHLWTDGSSINNGENKGYGGLGYVLLYGDFKGVDIAKKYCDDKYTLTGYSSATNTTNQREEIKSVIYALRRIKDTSIDIDVFSDSAYLVNCMNQRWYDKWRDNGWRNSKGNPVENQDLWNELISLIEDNGLFIRFNKVKGHANYYYNELADDLARKGLEESLKTKGDK